MQCLVSLPQYSNLGYINNCLDVHACSNSCTIPPPLCCHFESYIIFIKRFIISHSSTQQPPQNYWYTQQQSTALITMLPCVIVSPGTNIPTQSTSWSTLLETSVKRTPTVGCFPCCFQSFSATSFSKCDGHLSTSPESCS